MNKPEENTLAEKYSVIEEKFELTKNDGKVIRGVIYRPDSDGAFKTVIFSHGFNSCYKNLMGHGKFYAESGIAIIYYDFCGGGMETVSDGSMLDMTLMTEADDLKNMMDYTLGLPFVDKDQLYLQGESQGGLISSIVAVDRKDEIKGLVLWYPAFVIPDDSKKRIEEGATDVFGIKLSPNYDKVAISVDITELWKGFDKPVLIVHGDKDGIAPIDYSRRAIETYADAELVEIIGSDHGFNEEDSIAARDESIDFILR